MPERSVLCRSCANWIGRPVGRERRGAPRTCSAGLATGWHVIECESYVRRFGPAPEMSAEWQPEQSPVRNTAS
jgi:hypothetical protein